MPRKALAKLVKMLQGLELTAQPLQQRQLAWCQLIALFRHITLIDGVTQMEIVSPSRFMRPPA
jgi:hypothetical protein